MAQTIALMTENPVIDLATPLMNAEKVRSAQMGNVRAGIDNRMAGLNLEETESELGDIRDYRERAKANDPNALDALKGRPQIQAQMFKALDSMKPDQQNAARNRATAFGEVARTVLGMQPGEAQTAAWNAGVDKLVTAGYITPEMGEEQKASGPNQLILNQALTGEQVVQQYFKERGAGNLDAKTLLDIEEKVNDFRENYFGQNNYGYLDDEQVAARDAAAEAYRESLMAQVRAGGGGGAAAAAGGRTGPSDQLAPGGPKDTSRLPALGAGVASVAPPPEATGQTVPKRTGSAGASQANPTSFSAGAEQAEFDALPSGAWFVNPADGRVLQKK